jgi:hypothetical protein
METIYRKIGKHVSLKHKIFFEVIDPKSYAASVLLNEYYRDRDIDFYSKDWRYMFILKRTWLRHQRKDGWWICHYCGTPLYKFPLRNRTKQSLLGCVTVDHKKSAKEYEDRQDTRNFLCACHKCNTDKADINYETFMKIIENNVKNISWCQE